MPAPHSPRPAATYGDLVYTDCTRGRRCPACGRDHHCSFYDGEKGSGVKCMFSADKNEPVPAAPPGYVLLKRTRDGGYLYEVDQGGSGGRVQGKSAAELEAARKKAAEWEKRSKKMAKELWIKARANVGHPRVAEYLKARGITLGGPSLPGVPRALGFVADAWGKKIDGRAPKGPCMVAAVVDAKGHVTGVHRTFLDPGGAAKKWDEAKFGSAKQMLGACGGRAIRLCDASGPVLILTEGIENAGVCASATGLPAWSCLSAGGLKDVELPAGIFADGTEAGGKVCVVVIAADLNAPGRGKEHGTGEAAGLVLANKLKSERPWLEVVVRCPPPTPTHLSPRLVVVPESGPWKGKAIGAALDEKGKPEGVDWANVNDAHGYEVVREQLMGGIDVAAAVERAAREARPVGAVGGAADKETVENSAQEGADEGPARDEGAGTRADDTFEGGGGGVFGGDSGGGGGGGGDGDGPVWALPSPAERPIVGDDALERARKWLWENARLPGQARFCVAWWASAWWLWRDGRYVKMDEHELEARVRPWLAGHARIRTLKRGDEIEPINPTGRQVDDMLDAMRSEVWCRANQMPAKLPPNMVVGSDGKQRPVWGGSVSWEALRVKTWEERDEVPAGKVVLRNGVLDLNVVARTGKAVLDPHSPELFTATCLPFDLDAKALQALLEHSGDLADEVYGRLCPYWMEWLEEASDGDRAWQGQLQEMMGDTLSGDRTIEKIFMVVGVQRGGKGIIEDAVRAIMGERNVASPMLSSLAEDRFAPAGLVGKSVVYVPDGHIPSFGAGPAIVELLKTISGNGALTIRDLHSKAQTIKLGARIWLSCNTEPDLRDDSAALADRFIVLPITRSALGQERTEYKASIPREAPGILLWAIMGAIRLARKPVRRIDVCVGGLEVSEEYRASSAHIQTFVNECLEKGPGGRETLEELHAAYAKWCESEMGREPYGKAKFARSLKWITKHTYSQPRGKGDGRPRLVMGWQLGGRWRQEALGGGTPTVPA